MFDIYIPDFLRLRVVYLISASCWLHMRQPSSSSILSIPNLDPNLEAPLCQRFFFFFSLFLSPPRFHFLHPSSLPLPSPVVFPLDDSCSHPLYVSPFIPYLLISLSFSLSLRCHHYNAICNSPSVSLSRTISTVKRRKAVCQLLLVHGSNWCPPLYGKFLYIFDRAPSCDCLDLGACFPHGQDDLSRLILKPKSIFSTCLCLAFKLPCLQVARRLLPRCPHLCLLVPAVDV